MRFLRSVSVLGVTLATACSSGAPPPAPAAKSSPPAPVASRGLDPADMDKTAGACVDFYQYGDGGWLRKNPIPSDYPSWGAFNELDERNREILHQTLEKLSPDSSAAPGTEERKLGDFYASCMNETAIEQAGITPLQDELDRISKIRDRASLQGGPSHRRPGAGRTRHPRVSLEGGRALARAWLGRRQEPACRASLQQRATRCATASC